MTQRNFRNIFIISLSQFGMAFSFNFVLVFLPFYIHKVSPYSPRGTLLWVGLIMGCTSFAAAVMSPIWGSLASRYNPKTLFMRGLLSHAVFILIMGYVSYLPLLFILRMLQGVMGGISTVGFIIVSSSSSQEYVSRDIGLYQNSLTFGQLIGPPAGAAAASLLGYHGAFASASALVFVTVVFCYFNVKVPRHEREERKEARKHIVDRKTLIGWGLCFTATVQLMFLPSVLPDVFQFFHIDHRVALKWAGLVIMFYTCTAMIGNYTLCRLSTRERVRWLIITASTTGIVLQCLLSVSSGMVSFTVIRMLQTSMIAAILPLVISLFAADLDGRVIGFLNSGRFMGNGLGPMIATSVLAFSSLKSLFWVVGGIGVVALLGFAFFFDRKD